MRLIDADALFIDGSFFNDELDRAERFYSEEQIKNAPTIDRPQGEWKHESDCGITKCNKCGWSIEECIDWNYCPNCGARMDGAE